MKGCGVGRGMAGEAGQGEGKREKARRGGGGLDGVGWGGVALKL